MTEIMELSHKNISYYKYAQYAQECNGTYKPNEKRDRR